MDYREVCEILSHIKCAPFRIASNSRTLEATQGDWWLQVVADLPDSAIGTVELQKGRKWRLSEHMTKSEIVQTALAAVLAFAEHEARESFTYKGRAIFGPHFDVETLVKLVDADLVDIRESPVGRYVIGIDFAHTGTDRSVRHSMSFENIEEFKDEVVNP